MPTDLPKPIRHFLLVCVALELAALGAQLAGFGVAFRNVVIGLGGFWPSVLTGAEPAFPGQAITMFATSAVLHGNPLHLGMNMIGLVWLGPMVVARVGDSGFWPIAGLSALGAGLLYTALSMSAVPMVGASGVLYGLLGVLAVWILRDRMALGRGLGLYMKQAAVLVALNVGLGVVAGGAVAWQAHLGGFLAGAGCGLMTWRGPRRIVSR